jgi:hypothetical protein
MTNYKNFSDMVKDMPMSPEFVATAKELGSKAAEEIDALANPCNYEFAFDIEKDLILFRRKHG